MVGYKPHSFGFSSGSSGALLGSSAACKCCTAESVWPVPQGGWLCSGLLCGSQPDRQPAQEGWEGGCSSLLYRDFSPYIPGPLLPLSVQLVTI